MHVVDHQGASQHLKAVAFRVVFDVRQIYTAIIVAEEYILLTVASLRHVIRNTFYYQASCSWHGSIIENRNMDVKKGSVPFPQSPFPHLSPLYPTVLLVEGTYAKEPENGQDDDDTAQ